MTVFPGARSPKTISKLKNTRLWLSADLDADARDALERACVDIRLVSAGTDLQGAPADKLHILLDGWAARYKIINGRGRFIPALMVPGDICDIDALCFDQLNYGITMLSAGSVAVLPRPKVKALLASHPAFGDAFRSLAFVENSILTEWAASIGRRSATERVAHLLCELLVRLIAIGKADGHSYDLPLTQEQMADATGLTAVHTNRTLIALRAKDLVAVKRRRVVIKDWTALSALCGFHPEYLHLETIDKAFAPEQPETGARGRVVMAQHSNMTQRPSFASTSNVR